MIVTDFHSDVDAQRVEDQFNRISRDKQIPAEVEERVLAPGSWSLPHFLVATEMAPSMSEARRLIKQGGVYVDGERATAVNSITLWKEGMSTTLRVGPRRFLRVRFNA
jgi:tyrosyl-tRNA synthetase